MTTIFAAIIGAVVGALGLYMALRRMGRKRQIKTMDLILVILGVSTLIFTVTMIVIFVKFQQEPSTLIGCWFGSVLGEGGCMGWIRTTKEKTKEREWQKEDEKERRNAE